MMMMIIIIIIIIIIMKGVDVEIHTSAYRLHSTKKIFKLFFKL